ncbi:MAG TPA: metallophosphoesterase [Bacteroidales bacterium]
MIITVLSDIHGNLEKLEKISDVLSQSDLVLMCGDITHFGREKEVQSIIRTILQFQSNILAVTGNCDYPEVEHFLAKEGISIHKRSAIFEGIGFVGFGGSLPCPGKTPNEFSEDEFGESLTVAYQSLYGSIPHLLVVHHPPFKTAADRAGNGTHVGSLSVRNVIETYQPLACFCGHIHESKGQSVINQSYVINPGPFKEGNYALVKIDEGKLNTFKLLSV